MRLPQTCSSRLVNETSMDPATPTSSGVTATDSGLSKCPTAPPNCRLSTTDMSSSSYALLLQIN